VLETNTSETVPDKSRNNTRHAELPMGSENDESKKPIRTDLSKKDGFCRNQNQRASIRSKPKSKSKSGKTIAHTSSKNQFFY
jgi:hypothetical protein